MTLHLERRKTEGIVIIDLLGDLAMGPGHARLCDEVTSLVRAGFNKIIFNLQKVAKVDGAGLGALSLALMECRTHEGKVVLLHLDGSNIETSSELELDAEFETFRDEQEAINSFFPDRTINHYDILTFCRAGNKVSERKRARKGDVTFVDFCSLTMRARKGPSRRV